MGVEDIQYPDKLQVRHGDTFNDPMISFLWPYDFAYFRWFSGLFGKQHSHVLISLVKVGAAKTSAHKPQFWTLPYISYISHSPRKRGRRLSPPVLVPSCSTGLGVPYQRGPKGKLESWMLCTLVFYWFRTPVTCRWIYSTPPKTEKCLTTSWAGCCFSIYAVLFVLVVL